MSFLVWIAQDYSGLLRITQDAPFWLRLLTFGYARLHRLVGLTLSAGQILRTERQTANETEGAADQIKSV